LLQDRKRAPSCRQRFDNGGEEISNTHATLRVALIRKHLFDAIFEAELARKPAECGP